MIDSVSYVMVGLYTALVIFVTMSLSYLNVKQGINNGGIDVCGGHHFDEYVGLGEYSVNGDIHFRAKGSDNLIEGVELNEKKRATCSHRNCGEVDLMWETVDYVEFDKYKERCELKDDLMGYFRE